MSDIIVLKKGLDVPVSGNAEAELRKVVTPDVVAVSPSEFKGLSARLLVREGDRVLAGSPVLSDKKCPDIIISSPVSGTVKEIVRGEKRKLLHVLISPDTVQEYVDFGKKKADELSADEVKEALLKSGLWAAIISRPYGIIADPAKQPKAIFVSAFSTAPLAPSTKFALDGQTLAMQAGLTALSKIAKVHLSISKCQSDGPFSRFSNVEYHTFSGKHPAGNVGVQISCIDPIRKDETVWTLTPQMVAAIGKLFSKGCVDLRRKVAVCGPMAIQPGYIETFPGMPMKAIPGFVGALSDEIRFVSGDALSGKNVGIDGYLGFQSNQITLLKEGTEEELFGWARPFRFQLFSNDHSYFHWLLCPKGHKYDLDTNLHGGPRAFVMSDSYYGKVLPMDIYPLYLVKACLAADIDKMERFGIYEVLPEDLAVCEFIDPSKNYIQAIIENGIDLMLKEMA